MAKPALELTIEVLGLRGDGVARLEDGTPVFVPYALPGERVRVRPRGERGDGFAARLLEVLEPGMDRAPPACRHFGSCGGCALQHLAPDSYRVWKEEVLRAALARQGFEEAEIAPLVEAEPGTRRRADFTALRRDDDLLLGFNERESHRVIPIEECPVLDPAVMALVRPLRDLLARFFRKGDKADIVVNLTEAGPDLLLVTKAPLKLPAREALSAFAAEAGLARVSRALPKQGGAETIVELGKPIRTYGRTAVVLPPGAFQQATALGERTLTDFVLTALEGRKKVADLYAGCGAFTFALAEAGAAVHAVEGDAPSVEALSAAAKAGALNKVTSERRDLAKRPLRVEELNRFDAVVFDPPRAGAKEQAAHLAESKVKTVVAVSCNPATFARDARILTEGGYILGSIQPVDQFLWSPHLELAAVFTR